MAPVTKLPALASAEDALTWASKTAGALAQVSGAAAGFDVFTPTANCTYLLSVRVQDVATGAPTNAAHDLLLLTVTGTWTVTTINHTATVGTCATTWTKNASAVKLAVATGVTWYVDVVVLARFPA